MAPVQYNSNRQLHARNTKSVPVATKRINQVADLAQEQYNNALSVNGYDSVLYHRMDSGRICSCTKVFKHSTGQILDSNGNATQEHIQSLLTGADFAIEDYATTTNSQARPSNPALKIIRTISPQGSVSQKKPHKESIQAEDPFATELLPVQNLNDAFSEVNLGAVSANKCGVCYGSGFAGGYSVHNGNRFILDATYADKECYGYSIMQDQAPHLFDQANSLGEVRFRVTLPIGILGVDRIQVWNNTTTINDATIRIGSSITNLIPLNNASVMLYATGLPCYIVVSNVEKFSHLELQFNLSSIHTYIEYPRLTKTGDLSVLDAIDGVQVVVSPLVMNVQAWDIIVDNVLKKIWRVQSSNWFNDRKMNIQGWDVQARLVQSYEVFSNLAGRFSNGTRYVTTNLPRF